MKMTVCKSFRFDAAHLLPNYEGKCKNLHGHSWTLEVEVFGRVGDFSGMVLDFADLKEVVCREVIDKLDHTSLNDTVENPTAENILGWVQDRLRCLPEGMLCRLRLYETPGSFAELKL